jgi:LysR family transcriptional regulator, carnitine catabolism transcriptional activator
MRPHASICNNRCAQRTNLGAMDPVPDLSLRDLHLVLAVAELRSFTAAAEVVHLSQSALSRAVNDAERRAGARLFTRTTRSVSLTPVGEELVRIARDAVGRHEQGLQEFALFRDGLGGVVRVAALPSVAATALPFVVAAIEAERPGVVVDITDTLAHVATDLLVAGRVDFAVTVPDGLPDEVAFRPLLHDRFHVVFRPDHAYHGRDRVTWRELSGERLVTFGAASSLRALTDSALAGVGAQPDQTFEAQNIAVIAGLVAAGLGVAAAPAQVLPLMAFAHLESAELVEPAVDRTLGLAYVPGRSRSPAASYVEEALVASGLDGLRWLDHPPGGTG